MTALWIALALFIAGCALGVVLARNPISSAVWLLAGFLAVAVLYLALRAEFVAAVQVLVYAGGIMVLYLFGIMFVDAEALRAVRQTHRQAWPVFLLCLALFAVLGHHLYRSSYKAQPAALQIIAVSNAREEAAAKAKFDEMAQRKSEPNTVQVSRVLFGDFLIPFEVASVLLTVAVLGGIFLAKKEV